MQNPSDWELIDSGDWNGVRRWMRATDDDEGTVQVRTESVGIDSILDANKRADAPDKRSEMWHVGRIPASVGLKWLVEEGLDLWNPHHQDGIAKKLMDSDYRYLVPGMARISI